MSERPPVHPAGTRLRAVPPISADVRRLPRPSARRPGSPIRIGPVDLPPVVLAGLRVMARQHEDRVTLQSPDREHDVVLVDAAHRQGPLRLPDAGLPVVVLTRDGDVEALHDVRHRGAIALPIVASGLMLVEAVESAHRRRTPPASMPDAPLGRGEAPLDPLSPREEQVLAGICAGMSNTEIAEQLYVSINSIKTYIRSAYRKMDVQRRGQAVVWGMQHGYGDPRPGLSEAAVGLVGVPLDREG